MFGRSDTLEGYLRCLLVPEAAIQGQVTKETRAAHKERYPFRKEGRGAWGFELRFGFRGWIQTSNSPVGWFKLHRELGSHFFANTLKGAN